MMLLLGVTVTIIPRLAMTVSCSVSAPVPEKFSLTNYLARVGELEKSRCAAGTGDRRAPESGSAVVDTVIM